MLEMLRARLASMRHCFAVPHSAILETDVVNQLITTTSRVLTRGGGSFSQRPGTAAYDVANQFADDTMAVR